MILLREWNRWSAARTVLGQTEPAESHTRTQNLAASFTPILYLATNRKRPGNTCAPGLCTLNLAFESQLYHTCRTENVQRKRECACQLGLVDLYQFRKRKHQPVATKPHSDDSDSEWTPQVESHRRRKTKQTTLPSMSELAVEFGESDEECDSGEKSSEERTWRAAQQKDG